jgi:class 3 adenylate cyclase
MQMPLSCGVHAGEVMRSGAAVSGSAFAVAEAIATEAPKGEVWASRVLVDLVPGSDLQFGDPGRDLILQGREIAMLSLNP